MNYLNVDSTKSVDGKDETSNEDLEVDNSKSVLLKIATLYAEQLMSDLVLEVAGVGYPAHRLILCASSEVFQVMLMNREWSEWRESRIVLQETPTAASVFPHFLKYFYTGQIKISHQTVLPVLSLADKYNVKDLVTLCLGYMSQHIPQAARRGHLIAWMQYTMACGHDDVAKACQNYVKWNLECIHDSELAELEDDTLLLLLQHSDLVLHNEMTLYHFVVRWLSKQRKRLNTNELSENELKVHWDSLVTTVFSHVRFPMMCPNQLAKLLLCPLTQEHKEFFMERMAVAMSYQSGQYERIKEIQQTEAGRMLFTPRLYTEDTWGTLLAVDNFHSLPCYHTRTFIFSTKPSIADVATDKLTEWTVDLYPKGVWFKKSMLIVWAGTYDVPEVVLRTVRISITCQNCPEQVEEDRDYNEYYEPDVRVKIGILLWGVQDGVDHVTSVVERVHRFSAQNRVLNIDGALDFDELNTPLYTPASELSTPAAGSPGAKGSGRCPKCSDSYEAPETRHLFGPLRDQLRIQVVIVPLNDFCHVCAPDAHV
ncbi:BTB/POZ domain-containing protein 17 [Maniola hyperantus]|uniref:BTB/POZ domain-containing protein 17 n=1 Tax=Aphantopus hyperantus TaxID=2795564 RepID=UPI00156A4452|nr:BTB/POZ domain-containing protein 17 isoform X1 [Maniola hyperantus]XP_034828545.1 BTB/POZ domain-containing protein 17 isoform X1 [Maniola hyperantus]